MYKYHGSDEIYLPLLEHRVSCQGPIHPGRIRWNLCLSRSKMKDRGKLQMLVTNLVPSPPLGKIAVAVNPNRPLPSSEP